MRKREKMARAVKGLEGQQRLSFLAILPAEEGGLATDFQTGDSLWAEAGLC